MFSFWGRITGTGSNESGTTPGGFNPSGGESGSTNPNDSNGSNGSNNPNQPCDGNGVPSQPQEPGSTLENQPCNNGTVTYFAEFDIRTKINRDSTLKIIKSSLFNFNNKKRDY